MYRLNCRELTILGREGELQFYNTKIAITEIKAVKLCRSHDLKDLLSELASYTSEIFNHLLQRGKNMFSVGMRAAAQSLVSKLIFLQTASSISHENSFQT